MISKPENRVFSLWPLCSASSCVWRSGVLRKPSPFDNGNQSRVEFDPSKTKLSFFCFPHPPIRPHYTTKNKKKQTTQNALPVWPSWLASLEESPDKLRQEGWLEADSCWSRSVSGEMGKTQRISRTPRPITVLCSHLREKIKNKSTKKGGRTWFVDEALQIINLVQIHESPWNIPRTQHTMYFHFIFFLQ